MDPNSTYWLVIKIMNNILLKHNIQFMMPRWNIDIFFNEKIIQPDVLKLLLRHLKKMKNIRGVLRNIFVHRIRCNQCINSKSFITKRNGI